MIAVYTHESNPSCAQLWFFFSGVQALWLALSDFAFVKYFRRTIQIFVAELPKFANARTFPTALDQ